MNSSSTTPQHAQVHWKSGALHIGIGKSEWTVERDALPTLIHLLKAGQLLDRNGQSVEALPTIETPPVTDLAAVEVPKTKKRRSRKRVGDALIVWLEAHPGWHHEEHLLEAVIEHSMTDASPRRALKIALGKQRNTLFTDGGHGYWRLATDGSAGSPPRQTPSPSLGQRLLATTTLDEGPAAPSELDRRIVRVRKGESRREATQTESASMAEKPERWEEVSRDEVARARRNLLGLGSST